ncbi:putative myosin heavy chain [Leishmania mexicana MHOM/GT/2001/U1103]|uniref:Myosin heavy chain n=1 Tax=Leishmania mexicana (strain MHOM/GT/2001/U1103) TaxID=929439 RepID=E9B3G5_LEIMU|nr:putative myosin heavy chain [Leishmania mexicana MHOM/GT/2001/U1103]CBZ29782.1 putative myosin heavy chain [Leishmania mexicana MHOM/GT/2001/U1103]
MAERVSVNQGVYYFDTKSGWLRGTVKEVDGAKVTVEDNASQNAVKVIADNVHGYISESYDAEDAELFHVSDLHVATLLHCVKDRFEKLHKQYSLMGEMVLSVNPFRLMPFNSEEERKKYLALPDPRMLPPHIWQVAHKAFNTVFVHGQGNQSIVISGESGSGKTENAKMLIAYLGQLSYMHSKNTSQRSIADKIDENLTWSNPIMESFGNARTVRNDNSSRFGKYIKLYFDPVSGVMVGGQTVTYLLERSRIIMQSPGERNYHIFYEMLAGLSPTEKQELGGLKTAQDYKCLNGGNTFIRRGVDGKPLDDAHEFQMVRRALSMIGVPLETQGCILRVLAAILHLMEVEFESDNNDKAQIANETPLATGCALLCLDEAKVRECFLVRSKTSLVTILASKTEAEGLRNAFCKGLYVGMFDRLVEFVNAAIQPQVDCSDCKYVGLLDIFGFENFTINSFEQVCINYANESLQNHYNKYTFINDEEECRREGIQTPNIEFPDNSECVNMFDAKRVGIFSMLDEECNFKGGNTDRFTTNLWEEWASKNQYFVKPKSTIPNQFGVNHYAAFVNYNTAEWLEKNTDALKEDMYECVSESTDEFIRTLLSTEKSEARRKQTVAIRFQRQLTDLRSELESTETQFIRCIKPNMEASPSFLENLLVGSQLESAGVLQTISLKRQGYPVRRPLEPFCRYFYLVMSRTTASLFKQGRYGDASQDFLQRHQRLYNWAQPNYAVGQTKVFLRAEVWSALERLVLRRRAQLLHRCKPYLCRWIEELRERRRIEQQKRLEAARKLREVREAKAAGAANGVPAETLQWVEEASNVFPEFDMDMLMDVAVEADTREEALSAILAIQADRLDKQTASGFMDVMTAANVRRGAINNFISADIKTVSALSKLQPEDMKSLGASEMEVVAITKKLTEQQGQRVKYQRLAEAIGTDGEYAATDAVQRAEMARHQEDFDTKVQALASMGFDESISRLVLAHYNGDVQRTAARLLYGVDSRKMKNNARKHKDFNTTDANVQQLIALGATKQNAKMALRRNSGDANAAAKMLFKVS